MNPENQNPGGHPGPVPGQQPPYQGQPYNQQAPGPHVYGPQQFSPFPQGGGVPQQAPPKNNRKLIWAVIAMAVLLLITIGVAVFLNLPKDGSSAGDDFIRSYDSPVGLLPGMQSADIKSGKFKLQASYVGDGNFRREGVFAVKDGKLHFAMVADEKRVNELVKQLYDRRQGNKATFDAAKHGVTSNFSYDFASMAGYHYLYDQNGGAMSGFIPEVDAAKAASSTDKRFTLTTACDSALADVKQKLNMHTTSLMFDIRDMGVNKRQAEISFATRQSIDKAVRTFFDSCYDLNYKPSAALKKFVDGLKQNITTSPKFTYWQEEGVSYLEVAPPDENTPFGGKLHFELTALSTAPAELTGANASYIERRNQFGLAYSLCRTDPIITRAVQDGYRFLREDPAYEYPSARDSGYFCTTLSTPRQYTPAKTVSLRSTTGAMVPVTGAAIDGLRGLHDLTYEIEKYNLQNKRYPGPNEFRDMASSNMGDLTLTTQTAFASRSLVYTALPTECEGTCNDFVLSYVAAPNVQIQRSTYRPH